MDLEPPVLTHLLGLDGVPEPVITEILDTAENFLAVLERPIPKVPSLRGVTVANLFFENSTRTRISFELAEKRLSADTINFSTSGSSVAKGETLLDTVKNIEAMKVDVVVMRHWAAGSSKFLADRIDAKVVNAGDGTHEHPTQGLLDMLTIRRKLGALKGLKVLILGDIAHSRVARSNIFGLLNCGAEVKVCGPATLIPREAESLGVEVIPDLDEGLKWCNVVNVLRLQLERMSQGLIPSLRDYQRRYGLTRLRLEKAAKDIVVMHPGPMNRGVEIDSNVADGPWSVILSQVKHGVAVRMAALFLISGREKDEG
ncbi:MAG: aspartate carbamoyltransferase catalytic subunit [Calditrichaeota bacterium]|nr:aspartate carbamoyltransferase catalytic subunit [Calditrichota bacterium]